MPVRLGRKSVALRREASTDKRVNCSEPLKRDSSSLEVAMEWCKCSSFQRLGTGNSSGPTERDGC
jgi:hypothetical protein